MRCPFQAWQHRFFLPAQQTGMNQCRAFLVWNFKKSSHFFNSCQVTPSEGLSGVRHARSKIAANPHQGSLIVAIRQYIFADALAGPGRMEEGALT